MNEYDLVKPVIEYLPLAIIVVNKDRQILLSNKMAQIMSQKTENELIGLHGGEALGCKYSDNSKGCGFGERCRTCIIKNSVLESFRKKESILLDNTSLNFKDIGVRNLRVSISYLDILEIEDLDFKDRRINRRGRRKSDFNKEIAIITLEDITRSKYREKLETAIEVSGAICHEMNQPLQSILGYSELITLDDDFENVKRMVKKVFEQSEILGQLTKKLMSIKEYKTKPYLERNILDIDKSSK